MGHIKVWRRYIDDVFVVWEGPETRLLKFFNLLNTNNYNLKFTMTHDKQTITFLDVRLYVSSEGTLFRKSTTPHH